MFWPKVLNTPRNGASFKKIRVFVVAGITTVFK